jgi:disulfide bond formation protein DsbB
MGTTLKDFTKREPAIAGHFAYLLAAILTLGGAWYLQSFGGLHPCPLCLEQREPWYAGLTISIIVLTLPVFAPGSEVWRMRGLILNMGLLIWGGVKATEHIGLEHGWWGAACTSADTGTGPQTIEELMSGAATDTAVPCDAIQWEFLGFTLAGYNLVIQIALFALLGWLFWKAWKAR